MSRDTAHAMSRAANATHAEVAAHADAIEAEMRRIGLWQDEPLEPGQYEFSAAFAMDTMAFSQWLQFIFLPRVRQIVAERGEFPSGSMVAAQAVREFDGVPEATDLCATLAAFDALFNA